MCVGDVALYIPFYRSKMLYFEHLESLEKNSSTLVAFLSTDHDLLGLILAATNRNIEHGASTGRQEHS